ncbi:CHAT domain-containing protein [Amycolatopsis japonica]
MLLIESHISTLEARISAYVRDGESARILDDAAVDEAEALMDGQSGDLRRDLPILRVVGLLFWYRAELATGDERSYQLRTALSLLHPVTEESPESLPVEVVDFLRSPGGQYTRLAHRALSLLSQYYRTSDPQLLDPAIDSGMEALRFASDDEPDLTPLLFDVGSALHMRFAGAGPGSDATDATQSIELFRLVLSRAETEDQRSRALGSLASIQLRRYEQQGDLADLESSIDDFTELRASGRLTGDDRLELGRASVQRFEAGGDTADLDVAIAALEEGRRTADQTGYLRDECVRWLNVAYVARFDETGDEDDLHRGLRILRTDPEDGYLEPRPDEVLLHVVSGLLKALQEQPSLPLFDRTAILLRAALRTAPASDASLEELLQAVLYQRYAVSGHAGHLERTRSILDERGTGIPDSQADAMLRSVLQRTSGPVGPDVEEWAARTTRFLCALMPSGWHYRGLALASLSDFLRNCYLTSGNLDQLDEAIAAAREWPADEDPHSASVAQLANLLGMRTEHTDDRRHLDEAIAILETARDTDPVRSAMGALLLQRSKFGRSDDARRAVGILRRVVRETPEYDGNRPGRISNLAGALVVSFDENHDPAVLDEAIALHRAALSSTADETPRYLLRLGGLASALRKRGVALKDPASLNEAIVLLRRAADEGGPALRSNALDELIVALDHVSRTTGEAGPLDEMVQRLTTARTDPAFDTRQRFRCGSRLGRVLHWRYERSGSEADLDAAVDVLRRTASEPEPGELPTLLDTLGDTLRVRAERNGSRSDADAAVDAHREALALTDETDPEYSTRLAATGMSLCSRFEVAGDREDIDTSLEVLRRAVTIRSEDDRAGLESDLGVVLMRRFAVTQDQAELDESIDLQRRALSSADEDHTDRTRRLLNLSGPLRLRFERFGRLADLDEAIAAMRLVATDTGYRAGERPEILADLGVCLWARAQRTNEEADLNEAFTHLRAALDLLPEGHAIRPKALSGLAGTHMLLARRTRPMDLEQLTKAIELGRAAVAAAHPEHYQALGWQGNLAAELHDRHRLTGDERDRTESIAILENVLASAGALGADRGGWLLNLGHFLSESAQEDDDAYRRALAAYREAAELVTAPADLRCEAARWWGTMAGLRDDWPAAVAGYSLAVELLPLAVARGLHRSDQQFKLGNFSGLAPDAAACAIRAGDPQLALRLLEQGRGVLLAQALETRDEIADLAITHPDHARRFVAVRSRLDAPAGTNGQDNDVLHRLTAECDELIEEIRSLPGWSRFLRPPDTEEILRTVPDGAAAVVLNASRFGFDALIVKSGVLTVVPLDAVQADQLRLHAAELAAAIGVFHDGQADYDFRIFSVDKVCDCLAWLWHTVADPVFRRLGLSAPPEPGTALPRLWWVPTGAFTNLPLHAAGLHEDSEPFAHTVLDRVVSSYAPTLRSVVRAQRGSAAPDESGAIVVAATAVPGHPRLTAAEAEVAVAAAHLPRAEILAEAKPADVLATLDTVTYAHFACHAAADLDDPSRSHLVLHDGVLSIADIAARHSPDAFLAYLSACETSRTSTALADESIHIASAFQLAGFRHVIATLWPLSDSTARAVAEHVYTRLSSGPALALHDAIRRQREDDPGDVVNWIAPIHTGPE